jgi:O-antigen/teichoic acid export membrane protein
MLRRLGANVMAGAAGSFAALLAALVSAPIFLRLLGSEAFGVLGFVLALQAALLVLDGGVAISATRAVAQASNPSSHGRVADLLYGLARINWCVAALSAMAIALLAPVLAERWLNLVMLPTAYVSQSLAVAGVAIAARWPLAVYQAIVRGSQQEVRLTVINVSMTLISTAGAIAVLVLYAPDLRALFAWLAVTALAHALWCRRAAIGAIGRGTAPPKGEVPRFYRQSAAAGWLGLVGLLLMQMDKVVLSRVLTVDVFGYYVLASMVAGALYAIVTPFFHAVYPRLSALAAQADSGGLERLYRGSSLALAALIFPIAATLAFFAESVLLLWTGDGAAAAAAGPVVMLLALGTALHGVMFIPYALKLACGASKLALAIGVILLAISLPAAVLAATRWGAPGAAAAWLVLNLIYLVLGTASCPRWADGGWCRMWRRAHYCR